MKSSLKLVVGIVTYNPDKQTLQRISMLLDNGIEFVVLDNTTGDDFWPMPLRSRVIRDGKNGGVGVGIEKTWGMGGQSRIYSFVVFRPGCHFFNG